MKKIFNKKRNESPLVGKDRGYIRKGVQRWGKGRTEVMFSAGPWLLFTPPILLSLTERACFCQELLSSSRHSWLMCVPAGPLIWRARGEEVSCCDSHLRIGKCSIVSEQREMNTGAQFIFSLLNVLFIQDPSLWHNAAHFRYVFLSWLNLFGNTLTR